MNNTPFTRPMNELARLRISCRTFAPGGLPEQALAPLLASLQEISVPFATPLRPAVIDKERVKADHFFSSGTYGMISGVRHFLTAPMPREAARNCEDLGFLLETAVLHLTDRGFASCWIGGIFDRARFGGQIGLAASETLPAVIAMGHAADHRSWRDRVVRWSAKGDRRRPAAELFFDQAFDRPLPDVPSGPLAAPLACLRLAPSASNKQPWRVVLAAGQVHLFLQRDPLYQKLTPHVDLQRIDMGIAMSHFHWAACEGGLPGRWQAGPAPEMALPPHTSFVASWR
jgi:nitroreductase